MSYFAVTTVHLCNWDVTKSIRGQEAWEAHASFLDSPVDEGFVVLGGPLDEGEQALLIVEATGEEEVRRRLSTDPWSSMDMLGVDTVRQWSIWLDGRNRVPGS